MRPARALIDLDALRANFQLARELGGGRKTLAAIKAACAGIAGSAEIGQHCTISGAAMIAGHLKIADYVTVSAGTLITHSLPEAGTYTGAYPSDDHASWVRNAALVRHLAELADRVRSLERKGKKNG